MNRREFIANLSVLTIATSLPASLLASNTDKSWQGLYKQAALNDPRLIGHESYNHESIVAQLEVEGAFPKSFNGDFYRNGPALFERGNIRHQHLFDGDGMIQAFNFNKGNVSFKNKFIQTQKYKNEQLANKFLYELNDSGIIDPQPITSSDLINTANTNILPVGDELWALWEAGSAHRIDSETLETQGKVSFSKQLQGMPFSAHPKVEADGTIWNFGLDYPSGQIVLYKLNAVGKLQKFGIVKTNYHAMLHDFLITEKHILLILPSLKVDNSKKGFAQQQVFDKNQAMKVLVIDKNTFKIKATHEFDACFLFHFGNAWEENNGTIKFDGCRYPNLEVLNRMGNVMKGNTELVKDTISQSVIFTIYPNGKTTQEYIHGQAEFPRIYPSLTGKKNQKVFTIGDSKQTQWADSIRSLNIDTGKIDEYIYGNDYLVEEHVVIENRGKKGGYLIGTALNWKTKKTCVSLFDAENIKAGPVARAWLPFHIPLGFHGNFRFNS